MSFTLFLSKRKTKKNEKVFVLLLKFAIDLDFPLITIMEQPVGGEENHTKKKLVKIQSKSSKQFVHFDEHLCHDVTVPGATNFRLASD